MSKFSRWKQRTKQTTQQVIRDFRCIRDGLREFKQQGRTPTEAYQSLRRLYCSTNGRFNDLIGNACRFRFWKRSTDFSGTLFDGVGKAQVKQIAGKLRRDGFAMLQRRLPTTHCSQLLAYALSNPGVPLTQAVDSPPCIFDRDNPQSLRHQFGSNELFSDPTIQHVATDPFFFSVAQEYLGFNPVLDLLTMWWSAPGDNSLQSKAAQLYHFDMDRFRFVKFFVYLTDVTTHTGPHCYVRGSHRRKPADLLRDERISDAELANHYPKEAFVELTGPAGTILAVDTRGFHKGKPLEAGDRLIFQIQFADSLFGQNYPPVEFNEGISELTLERIRSNHRCYSNFIRKAA
jgi:hypothetical protein